MQLKMDCYSQYVVFFVSLCMCFLQELNCFELTLLHTNDVHARIEEMNKYGGPCTSSDSRAKKCFGGVARRQTAIKDIRRTDRNVLLLDAGDQFQGTVWFNVYKGLATAFFMNKLGYDAMVRSFIITAFCTVITIKKQFSFAISLTIFVHIKCLFETYSH